MARTRGPRRRTQPDAVIGDDALTATWLHGYQALDAYPERERLQVFLLKLRELWPRDRARIVALSRDRGLSPCWAERMFDRE